MNASPTPAVSADTIGQESAHMLGGRISSAFTTRLNEKKEHDIADIFSSAVKSEDQNRWKGWCEVESEPAFLDFMLRGFGITGVKVQEVVSLEEVTLGDIPKPVYGLVFLFQVSEDISHAPQSTCPVNLWFANQTTSNACATIALLNIVMNVPGIDLGPNLEQLKDFSMSLTPTLRGIAISNHDFIRQVHNSFTRMDWLNADLLLSNEASFSKKKTAQKTTFRHRQPRSPAISIDSAAAYHYIAFVPVDGIVWKLDGLDQQPTSLGSFDGDWTYTVQPLIAELMSRSEVDQTQFSLLSLCRSPHLAIPEQIAASALGLHAIETRLNIIQPDWREFIAIVDNSVRGPDASYGVTQVHLDVAQPSPRVLVALSDTAEGTFDLISLYEELVASQTQLRAVFLAEIANIEENNQRAHARRFDYTPLLYSWASMLSQHGVLKDTVRPHAK